MATVALARRPGPTRTGATAHVQRAPSLSASAPFLRRKCRDCGDEQVDELKLRRFARDGAASASGNAGGARGSGVFVGAAQGGAERHADAMAAAAIDRGTAVAEPAPAPQRAATEADVAFELSPLQATRLARLQAGGAPLAPAVRRDMEQRFGADFGRVRLHDDQQSVALAKEIDAEAFAYGEHVVLASAQASSTQSPRSRALLAHELAHVVQSRAASSGSAPRIMRQSRLDSGALFGAAPDLLGELAPRPRFGMPEQEGDVLQFTHRFFPSTGLHLVCPKAACHEPSRTRGWRTPQDRRVTEPRLLAWALDVGTEGLLSDASLIALQLAPGSAGELVRQMHSTLIKNVLASHEFEGTAEARANTADALALRWGDVGPILQVRLQQWFQEEFFAALRRTPEETDFVTRASEYANLIVPVYRDTVTLYRALGAAHPVSVGGRFGDRIIVGVQKYGGIWFHLNDQPYFFYSSTIHAFNRWDPVLREVSRQVADNTKFAAELMPMLVQAAGFTLGLSARLGFVMAGIALEELGEEMQRDVRGQKPRSLSEILKSAGKSLLIDRVLNRAFGGSAGPLEGTTAKTAATAEERAAVAALEAPAERAVKRELADTDAAQVAGSLRAGGARPVKDAKLAAEGYVVEVKIVSEGQEHVYRQLADGTWCRFSKRICGIDLGADVAAAARSATEVQLEQVRGTLEQIKHEIEVLGRVHDRLRTAGGRGQTRIDPSQLTQAEREVLDDIAPSGAAADLTLAELGRLRRTRSSSLAAEYRAQLDVEASLIERLRDEARPLYDKMRAASPREAQRRKVLGESRGLDAVSRGSPRSGDLAVDHIVPLREIVDMKGFKELHFDDQLAIVNDVNNLRAIDAVANSSRGDRAWSVWPQARNFYDAAALARMRKLETELRSYLEHQISAQLARRRR